MTASWALALAVGGPDAGAASARLLLAPARYPTIGFRSLGVREQDGRWVVEGALSVKGKEAPLNLEITSAALAGNTLEIRAEATVDRYAYGVSAMKGMASWYLRLVLAIQATRS